MSISKDGCAHIISLDADVVVLYSPEFYIPIYSLIYLAINFRSFHQTHTCQAPCRTWTWLGVYIDIPRWGRG